MQEVIAKLRFFRMGPRKMRLIADLIRGHKVSIVMDKLFVMDTKAAKAMLKLLQSAVANAKSAYALSADTLRVKSVTVDGGPALKRWMPRAHGRATPVRERTSHVNLILVSEEPVEKKEKKVKKVNKKIKE